MNVLYSELDSLEVMESLPDEGYDFIYLDPPYFTGEGFMYNSTGTDLRRKLAKEKGVSLKDITSKEIEEEKNRQERIELKKYSDYIAQVIENTHRLLRPNGVLAFLSPGKEYVDINYRLMLDQFFSSSMIITIERPAKPMLAGINNDDRLYFYAKEKEHEFPVLKELRPIEEFSEKDDYDYYEKMTAFSHGPSRPNLCYEWHGIYPKGNTSWRYPSTKMDQLYEEGRVLIENGRVSLKRYRSECPVVVSSVWKARDNTRCRFSIDSQSLNRMFEMFANTESSVLCPFDRCGKFAWTADSYGVKWTSAYIPGAPSTNLLDEIPEDHYVIKKELISEKLERQYKSIVVTNVQDITELRDQLEHLADNIRRIQHSLGLSDLDTEADTIIARMHEQIEELSALKTSREYADNMRRVTDRLSEWSITLENCLRMIYSAFSVKPDIEAVIRDAKNFIVAGEALYEMFVVKKEYPLSDYGCIAIEYYKALEYLVNELFYVPYYIAELEGRSFLLTEEAIVEEKLSGFSGKQVEKITFVATASGKQERRYKPKLEYGSFAIWGSQLNKENEKASAREVRNFLTERNVNMEKFVDFCEKMKKTISLRNACAHPDVKGTEFAVKARDIVFYRAPLEQSCIDIKPKDIYELILKLPRIFVD